MEYAIIYRTTRRYLTYGRLGSSCGMNSVIFCPNFVYFFLFLDCYSGDTIFILKNPKNARLPPSAR